MIKDIFFRKTYIYLVLKQNINVENNLYLIIVMKRYLHPWIVCNIRFPFIAIFINMINQAVCFFVRIYLHFDIPGPSMSDFTVLILFTIEECTVPYKLLISTSFYHCTSHYFIHNYEISFSN